MTTRAGSYGGVVPGQSCIAVRLPLSDSSVEGNCEHGTREGKNDSCGAHDVVERGVSEQMTGDRLRGWYEDCDLSNWAAYLTYFILTETAQDTP